MMSENNGMNAVIEKIKNWSRINSPWAIHFNSGSCNGCDIEILATLTPRYDVERFGIKLQGSPRHADVLIATGPVTLQARERLVRVYEQMPEPKFVIAVGSCALSGGVFDGCYNVVGDLSKVIPVDVFVPGCPPRPEAIIYGVVQLLESLKAGKRPEPMTIAEPVLVNESEEE
ncbi:MAG: NADH-quinone oxidoreductase subunit B [Chloroflexi bacterium HGW-Chloroflexi-10]|nr:MAG: NADH-quinone oxidoreductase subunit B [Chloroflexi bacterium HGW-Chloroflexi-10]